ncbi:TusE/DsrC/DsvC family sulfur relay protein [Desulforhopalus singaporensis]|uniref:tRNA 2-thiouridine synthesizing protein E n=1 Tax=Desulforhopalus singaporensis TaxID=91360 RepID=A0A1H0L3D9_9BACT|nr:TusE/DsrC/DsvC family sulfur relay protein [Desulforhopalus singaporensis]SDO62491.1 tRNA 2-thiouridine synthesizing protein E [Desulforhopalus singaporensis]
MTTISHYLHINGKKYLISENYQLLDLNAWDHKVRDYIAQKLDLALTNDHKRVIELIRKSYTERKRHPYVRVVTADMAKDMGPEKGTMKYFYNLFPRGIHQAFQIAGLPMQGFCF